ncbi:MAG: DUF4388 domain-containing protein [Candidatus Obscuribacterales bacterium]|nr:DUF4388 domain-containing protein [Candidatus Obscuribacterales bacterium]
MFGKERHNQPGKIRLPKQAVFPDYAALKNVFEQAQVNRGQEVELSWSIPNSHKSYVINIKFDRVTPNPAWQLWEDDGRQTKLVSKFETTDLNLILDVVMMLETQNTGNPRTTGSFQAPRVSGAYPVHNPQANQATQSGAYPPFQGGQTSGGFQSASNQQYANPAGQTVQPTTASGAFQTFQGAHNRPAAETISPAQASQREAFTGTPIGGAAPQNRRFGDSPTRSGPAAGAFAGNLPSGSLPADFYSEKPAVPASSGIAAATSLEGNLENNKISDVLTTFAMSKVIGMLEVVGDSAIANVFFVDGVPRHAQVGATRGDDAIKELVTWRTGTYTFRPNKITDMISCERSLQASIMEGTSLLDQLRHLEEAGLVYESMLVLKQKNLGETELKLLLSKGHPLDFQWQKEMYELLKRKRTFTDLLRDKPMEMAQWAPLLFNFLYCGILEIKSPSHARAGALEFLGQGKQAVHALKYNFMRPDTGIYSAEALLYFIEYEYYRFEAYNWPLAFILFEASKRKSEGSIATEMLAPAIITTAARRIDLVKRPLDSLGHFEGAEFGLILPNTRPSQAAFVANRILDALTNTPLSADLDRRNLVLSFGVAGLPADGDDLQSLIESARAAKNEAKEGTFPIVLSRNLKRDG